ncbi:hypothetical protein [Thiohalocapsa halophila]|uniref:hypothetical protein n=1 Tax=Thiohalocapsa halophila TaxID=69359 RepID=UPI00190779D2|nr:hypothetical protein [Thiohalocapsa halophila]
MPEPTTPACTPARLLAHADAIEHAAARGGYVNDRTGARVRLEQPDRERWASFAALLRGTVHEHQGGCDD